MENFEELKRAVEIVELKDARAHNIVALDSTVPFLSCFSQVIGDTLCDSLQPIDFKRGLNEICELYGSSLSLDAVEESCRRFGLEASAAICFKAARIVILLIDDGIKLNKKLDIQWHETLVPTVGRILQVEHVAEKILEKGPNGTLWTLGSFMEAFTKELKSEAEKVVAFKSIVAHHNGLSVNTEVTQKEAEESLNDVLCARKPIRISNKSFVDYIFMHALEVAQNFDLPMQIDTDFGDKDLDLRPANPLNLRNLLEDKRFTNNRIVLLHASFPFIKEASYLASVYPQVYLDFGLAIPKLSFQAMVSSLKEILELAPMNKVMNNTGGIAFAERFYLGAKKAREVVFKVLWDACIDGDLSITEALAAVNDIFAQNAKQFYKLDASSRYSDVESQSLSSSQKEELNGPLTDVKLVRLMWLDFSAQHRCRVVLQHRFYSSVKNHGLGLTVECIRLSSTSDNLSEEHSLPPSGEVRVVPDLSTKCRLPWARNQEMVLVDMLTEPGKAWQYCPRDVLRRFSKMLEDEFGLVMNIGIEVEFHLLKRVLKYEKETWVAIDRTSYCSTAAIDIASSVLEEAVASLQCLNIIVEQIHSEAGKGQFEIVLGYTDCDRAANNLIIAHEVVKGVARKYGLLACFTPRCWLGSHVHISLSKNGENVFTASEEPNRYGMSKIGESFVAGVLDHLRSICVFTMPITNSYERQIFKSRNSYYLCWGIECKELIVRACCPPGAADIVTNFEITTFDGTANPHLGLACIIIAGINGLRRRLPIPEPVEPEAYVFDPNDYNDDIRVPGDLRDSIIHMDSDEWFKDMLGENFLDTRGGGVGVRFKLCFLRVICLIEFLFIHLATAIKRESLN
ncbi:protein fluG-like [Nicotiana tabacum]|uniref:Protein fluG-like n=1 Tax=Nicotiana tabacum TaxID=4097 RepID=A0AC58TCZ8_TOBAC